jgi:4-carboxymuconolactone decarboxylase
MTKSIRRGATVQAVSDGDVRVREEQIIGRPPRVEPLQAGQYGPEALEMLSALRRAISSDLSGAVPEYIATGMRHPALFRRHVDLSLQLYAGTLSARDSEIAVLRTGWLCQAPYLWGQHVVTAKRLKVLSSEEIDRITLGSDAVGWVEYERALLQAAEEMHSDVMISDETWAVLARTLNERQLIELPILVGQYRSVACLQNSLRVRLMPGNPGLAAR